MFSPPFCLIGPLWFLVNSILNIRTHGEKERTEDTRINEHWDPQKQPIILQFSRPCPQKKPELIIQPNKRKSLIELTILLSLS
jgi:hypothetical protein